MNWKGITSARWECQQSDMLQLSDGSRTGTTDECMDLQFVWIRWITSMKKLPAAGFSRREM